MAKNKNVVICKSERLYLTPLDEVHAPAVLKWYNDPELFGHLRDIRYVSHLDEQVQWIRSVKQDPFQKIYAIYSLQDDVLIGDIGIMHINWQDLSAEVGLIIGERAYQRKGLGTEATWLACKFAFEQLQLHNLIATINLDNIASIHLHEKVGFKKMGVRRQARRTADQVIDLLYYDLLPEELIKPDLF
ncbi:MAG: GNAT family N-acetyltransferase [Deltaproteobacteria bacterium]|nr:GNAT family N-acetyltransferase [Deltaproteobacteria bacterium]